MYPHTIKEIQSNLAAVSFLKPVKPPHESHVYAISVSDYPSADLLNYSEAELYHRMNVSS